jgi:hypothetical protein
MPTLPFTREDSIFPLLSQLDAVFPDLRIYSLQYGLMIVSAVKATVELDRAHHIHLYKSMTLSALAEKIGAQTERSLPYYTRQMRGDA